MIYVIIKLNNNQSKLLILKLYKIKLKNYIEFLRHHLGKYLNMGNLKLIIDQMFDKHFLRMYNNI